MLCDVGRGAAEANVPKTEERSDEAHSLCCAKLTQIIFKISIGIIYDKLKRKNIIINIVCIIINLFPFSGLKYITCQIVLHNQKIDINNKNVKLIPLHCIISSICIIEIIAIILNNKNSATLIVKKILLFVPVILWKSFSHLNNFGKK
jgi:hypothetical protein